MFERGLLELLDAVAVVTGVSFSSYAVAIMSVRADISTAILDAFLPDVGEANFERRARADEGVIQGALDRLGETKEPSSRYGARSAPDGHSRSPERTPGSPEPLAEAGIPAGRSPEHPSGLRRRALHR